MTGEVVDLVTCPDCGALEREINRGRRVEYRHVGRSVDGCVIDLAERGLYRAAAELQERRHWERLERVS